jgi:hypothetical protein
MISKFIKPLTILFFFNVLVANMAMAASNELFELPITHNDYEKLLLFQAIRAELPSFLNAGVEYGFDPFEVLEDQQRLLSELNKNPQYHARLAERPGFVSLTIKETQTKQITEKRVDPKQIAYWQAGLQNILKQNEDAQSVLIETLIQLNKRSVEGLLNGLIKSLPNELKQQAFKQPGNLAKISFLEGINNLQEVQKSQLNEIKEVSLIEKKLRALTELSILLQNEPGKWLERAQADERIRGLSDNDLNLILDFEHYVKPRLSAINENIRQYFMAKKLNPDMAVRSSVVDSISQEAKARLSIAAAEDVAFVKRNLILTELRPSVGIFRACAGGDCSTKFSFAAPDNPDELVFLLTNAQGDSKGYVEATRLWVNGQPTLYISSINGPRISSDEVEVVLSGLYKERQALHVSHIAIPQAEQINSLMNYPAIKTKMASLVEDKPTVQFVFGSVGIRSQIENFKSNYLTATYDDMKHNSRGVLYHPMDGASSPLETKVSENPLQALKLDASINKALLVNFILTTSTNKMGFVNRAVHALGINDADWAQLKVILLNPNKKPIAQFEEDVLNKLKSLLHEENLSLASLEGSIFLEGRLNAPDALSPAQLSKTARLVVEIASSGNDLFFRGAEMVLKSDPHQEVLKNQVARFLLIDSTELGSGGMRTEAGNILGRIFALYPKDQRIKEIILTGLASNNHSVRMWTNHAMLIYASSGNISEAIELASSFSNNSNSDIRANAASAIADIIKVNIAKKAFDLGPIQNALADNDANTRANAIKSLVELSKSDKQDLDKIASLLSTTIYDRNPFVRRGAAYAPLEMLKTRPDMAQSLLPIVKSFLSDGDQYVALFANKALIMIEEINTKNKVLMNSNGNQLLLCKDLLL